MENHLMADDTIRVTTESTEKDDQNGDTENESRRVQDLDRTITPSEATPTSEEDKKEVNTAIEELKADREISKKKLSDSKLEYGKSVGSSSVADDMLSEGIGFNQNMSSVKLSGEQFEVGGSSTKQQDQNDGSDDNFLANISILSRCVRDVDRTITRIEATPTTEEEAGEFNAALKLLKADHDILKTMLSELKLGFGKSAASSAEQEDQKDAIEDEIRVNISNLSRCVQDIDRAMERMQATPRTKEETEKLNAAFQLLKNGQDIVKNNLTKRKLEVSKSVGSPTPTADKVITASGSSQQDVIDEEKMEGLKAPIEKFDTSEDAVKTKLNELQREFSKSIGLSSLPDNAIITDSKSSEEDQEIRHDKFKKRFGDSRSDVGESKEMQKSSEFQGDFSSDSGESMNEEQRRAMAESTADISFTEGGVVRQKLMDSIKRGEEFVHMSSADTEELQDVPIGVSEPETSLLMFDLVDQAMQQVEDVLREVEDVLREAEDVRQNLLEDLEAANRQRWLNGIQLVITAVIAGLAALCAFFGGRAKEGKGQGGNKD